MIFHKGRKKELMVKILKFGTLDLKKKTSRIALKRNTDKTKVLGWFTS